MTRKRDHAARLLTEFKGDDYIYGLGCFGRLGELTAMLGRRACVVTSGVGKEWGRPIHEATRQSLEGAGVRLTGEPIVGARPNAPREDVFRIADAVAEQRPDVVVAVGGGSGIDATKAAVAYWTLRDAYPNLDDYFGVGQVSRLLAETGRAMPPVVAAQLAAGSAAHLTKYSNITSFDEAMLLPEMMKTASRRNSITITITSTSTREKGDSGSSLGAAQKMLIVDDAIVPARSLFEYSMTTTMSRSHTMDGGLDGVAHCLEVLYGIPDAQRPKVEEVCILGIDLIISHLKTACDELDNLEAREALGLGTDLGGYAIMLGGTNGAHLTSFSLVDILAHGRACALMNPYYTVFFAPAIEDKLRAVGAVYKNAGYTSADLGRLHGRDLGLAVADAMLALSRDIGFPTTLREVQGFTDEHTVRALAAAKNPKLDMKLKSMPVALSAETIDDYMGPILEAAKTGDFGVIRNLPAPS